MKKLNQSILAILLVLGLAFCQIGCSKNLKPFPNQNNINQSTQPSSPDESKLMVFTPDILKNYDGQNGNPAYVAVEGKVYDVTNSEKWKNGQHDVHKAGIDLTPLMQQSPHGTKVVNGLPVVGTLVEQQ